jgi:hypothetical protein
MFGPPLLMPSLYGEEPPKAEEKAEEPKKEEKEEKKAEEYDWKIGEKLDGKTVTKIITDVVEATKQKGSFWRNPALWEVVFTVVMIVLGILAAKFGWKKKKWGKIIQAVEKAVTTIYVEFVREAKLKNKDNKLTKDEMMKALEDAWNMTKDDLKNQGIDLAKWVAKEYFPVIADKVIKGLKKN